MTGSLPGTTTTSMSGDYPHDDDADVHDDHEDDHDGDNNDDEDHDGILSETTATSMSGLKP